MIGSLTFALSVFAVALALYVFAKYLEEQPTGAGPVPYPWLTLVEHEKEPEEGDDGDE